MHISLPFCCWYYFLSSFAAVLVVVTAISTVFALVDDPVIELVTILHGIALIPVSFLSAFVF